MVSLASRRLSGRESGQGQLKLRTMEPCVILRFLHSGTRRLEAGSETAGSAGCSDADATDSGPQSFEDIMSWADKFLCSASALLSMQGVDIPSLREKISSKKVLVTTSYSGIGVPEIAFTFLKRAFQQHGGDLRYAFHASTDFDQLCQRVLSAHHQQSASDHLFGDLLEKIPQERLAALKEMQTRYLARFNAGVKKNSLNRADRKALLLKLGRSFVAEGLKYLSENRAFEKDCSCYCSKHLQKCRVWPDKVAGELRLEAASVTCTPWSSSGKQMGWLDVQSIASIVWMHSMLIAEPCILVHECTRYFDVEVLERVFQHQYLFATNVFGPEDMGIPCSRERRYTVLIRKDLGGDLSLFAGRCFHQLISARVTANANIFLRASDSEVTAFLNTFAEQRGLVPESSAAGLRASIILSPWLRSQLEKYKQLIENSDRFAGKARVFVDLSQDPAQRPRVNEMIPCLLRNSFIYSMELKRPLHPLGMMAVQCLPIMLPQDSAFASLCPWPAEFLASLSRAQMQQILGNTMCLPAVGSVLMCALLSVAK